MSFNKYYQDELSFLNEMGKEFSEAYPAIAPMLSGRGGDPDVERLLEGFSFLTGRLRQKLDDEFPELTHAMMNLLWPHYLRPIPSMSILEFTPLIGAILDKQTISAGVEVDSIPIDGTPCRFRTCYDVDLYPFSIEETSLLFPQGKQAVLSVLFKGTKGMKIPSSQTVRFYLTGEPAFPLYLYLCRHLKEVRFLGATLPPTSVRPVGFAAEEALLPYPKTAFSGYRLLQEYFTFPEKFLFIEVTFPPNLPILKEDRFTMDFVFSSPPPVSLRILPEHIRLFCTPIVNLMKMESEPIRCSHDRTEYRIRTAHNTNPSHFDIYSIDHASGWKQGTAIEQKYEPFYSFAHGLSDQAVYYQTRLRTGVVGGTDTYVAFVHANQETALPPTETVLFKLTCSNLNQASKLRVGDIQSPTENTPGFVSFRNISRVTQGIRIPLGGDLYWKLISHLSLNYLSLASVEGFRAIFSLYNVPSLYDRQAGRANELRIEGIQTVESTVCNRLLHGTPVRGTKLMIGLIEDHFASEGDLLLFGTVMNEFLSLYASLNSFSQLVIKGVQKGEMYQWPPKIGTQILL